MVYGYMLEANYMKKQPIGFFQNEYMLVEREMRNFSNMANSLEYLFESNLIILNEGERWEHFKEMIRNLFTKIKNFFVGLWNKIFHKAKNNEQTTKNLNNIEQAVNSAPPTDDKEEAMDEFEKAMSELHKTKSGAAESIKNRHAEFNEELKKAKDVIDRNNAEMIFDDVKFEEVQEEMKKMHEDMDSRLDSLLNDVEESAKETKIEVDGQQIDVVVINKPHAEGNITVKIPDFKEGQQINFNVVVGMITNAFHDIEDEIDYSPDILVKRLSNKTNDEIINSIIEKTKSKTELNVNTSFEIKDEETTFNSIEDAINEIDKIINKQVMRKEWTNNSIEKLQSVLDKEEKTKEEFINKLSTTTENDLEGVMSLEEFTTRISTIYMRLVSEAMQIVADQLKRYTNCLNAVDNLIGKLNKQKSMLLSKKAFILKK